MEFMILIYADERTYAEMTKEQLAEVMAAYNNYTNELIAAGVLRGGSELAPVRTASTVRVRDGKTLVTDGPYAEAKEHLGGYYLLDCPSQEEAIAWAAKCPSSGVGSIEVRPQIKNT